jgi:hypothetical protein
VWLHHKIGKKIKNKNKEAIPENFSGEKSFSILFVFERQYGRGITQVVHAASVFCIIMHQLKHRVARKFHLAGGGAPRVLQGLPSNWEKNKKPSKTQQMYSLSYDCLHTTN